MKSKNKLPPWLLPKEQTPKMKLSVGWYTEEQWCKVKEASVDSERFEETYAEWEAMDEDAIQKMLVAGLIAEKFCVNSDELLAWCILHGKKNDASSRAEFVSFQSSRRANSDA